MLKDVKTMIDKIEENYLIKYIQIDYLFRCSECFKFVLLFINAWHFEEENLIEYLKESVKINFN